MEPLELNKVATALRLDPSRLDAAQVGALALVKATGELLRHCPDEAESTHTFQALLQWVRVLVPEAEAHDARSVANWSHPARDPLWLAALHFDPRASAAFPGELLVAALVAAVPREHADLERAWDYVSGAARRLCVSPDGVELFRGWSDGSASESVRAQAERRLGALTEVNATCEAVVRGILARANRQSRYAWKERVPAFGESRAQALAQIEVVLAHAAELHVEVTGIARLREHLKNDYFRVAVLGEFNRGKSTLVNALLESPDLMPTDILPCTSALTRIRFAPERRFTVRDPETGASVQRTEAQFRERVSEAALVTSSGDDAASLASAVPRWTMGLPNELLRHDLVELVDSPGLGEDHARDHISKEEALRADAAILVFEAKKLATLQELDLIERMKAKLQNLIIAVNQADLVPEAQWPRLAAHVAKRIDERGLSIPPERILFVSALNAEEAVRAGRFSDPWVARMRTLRSTLKEHLLSRSGPLKASYLATRLDEEVVRGRAEVARYVSHRRAQLAELERRHEKHLHAKAAHDTARADIAAATGRLRDHAPLAASLFAAFSEALPGLLERVGETRDQWKTTFNPLRSPNDHVKDVANQALAHTRQALERWFLADGARVLQDELGRRLDAAALEVASLAAYLEEVKGRGEEDRATFFEDLKKRTLQDAFEDASHAAAEVDALGRSVIVAVVSLVVGYVVADIVLFYLLQVIAGFIALPLLIAAVAVGTLVGATMGDEFARKLVRDKVFEKIRSELTKPASKEKLRAGIDRAMRDVSQSLSVAFAVNCNAMLDEARVAEERAYRDLEAFAAQAGTKDALQAEVARLDAAAAKVGEAFTELAAIAASIRPNAAEAT